MIKDTFKVPVCIINGAGNGSAVELHKRNNLNPMDLKTFYGRFLYRATKAKVASGVKGVLWHQGEANSGFAGNYYKDFKTVYTAWREDYPSI